LHFKKKFERGERPHIKNRTCQFDNNDFKSGSLRMAEDVKEAESLIQELSTYQLKRSESGHVTYGAMTGDSFDDLVTSLGLSLFSAVTFGSSPVLIW
jgi:hypothetical protein